MKKFTFLCLFAILASISAFAETTITWTITGVPSKISGKPLNTTLNYTSVPESAGTWTVVTKGNCYAATSSGAVQLGSGSYAFNGTISLSNSIIPETALIKNITIVATTNATYYVTPKVGTTNFGNSTTIVSGGNTSIDGEALGNEIVLTFASSTKKNVVLKSISVTYEENPTLYAPSITGVENDGVYYSSATVKISKPLTSTAISYTVKNGETVVDEETSAADAFSKTYTEPGTYTVSASATDGTNTLSAEDVTFTIKSNKVASIAEFLATAPSYTDIDFEFNCKLFVTYVSGRNLYVRDEAGDPLLIYMPKTANEQFTDEVNNGDYFKPGVTGKYQLHLNTIQELVPTTLPDCYEGAPVEPKEITIEQAAGNMSQYVKIKNVKFKSATEIAYGDKTLVLYGTLPTGFDMTAQYTVIGVISYYGGNVQLNYISSEEEKVLGTPGIEVTGATNAEGSYLDKASLTFKYPANATSMAYVVKRNGVEFAKESNLTKDATLDITICGEEYAIEVTAYMGEEDLKIANKTITVIPSAPTVSLAAGTYYETQTLTITAPAGATLDGALGDETISGTTFSTTLELVAGETKKYELLVSAVKDDVSSDIFSAVYTIDGQVVAATVTGVIVTENQDENKYIAPSSNMKEGTNYTLIDDLGTEFSVSAVKNTASNLPFRSSLTISTPYLMRVYTGNVVTISSENDIKAVEFSINKTELKIDGETVTNSSKKISKEYETGTKSLTFEAVSVNTDIYSISITYAGKVHYDKVDDGAALIGMKKGKLYKVNVVLQGIEANAGVLYARTSAKSAAPSEPNKNYFDKSYEDYDWESKYVQRDWVAINGLTSDYEGKEVVTGFIASYDGETLTPVADTPAPGSQVVDVTNINTFSVANVFYGNYENTKNVMGGYEPFFVKAKVNEVANYAGTLSKDSASEGSVYRLTGSGVCGKFEGKGVLIEPANEAITAALDEKLGQYQIIEGVLLTETSNGLANGDVKIVALAGPTDAPTGVAALKADGKATVYGTEGAVVVNGADGKVMIFDAMGRMVKNVSAEGAATVAMPAGYYIVRTAGTAAKVMVK